MTSITDLPTEGLFALLELTWPDGTTVIRSSRKAIKAEIYKRTEERLGLATRGLSPQDEGTPDLRDPHPGRRETPDRGSSTYKWLDDLDVGPGRTSY